MRWRGFEHVETLGFDYGQRHHVELQARLNVLRELRERFPQWATRLGDDHVLDLAVLGAVSDTSLTRDMAFRMEASGLPNTFVPGRNLLFLTLAAALAYRRGMTVLVTGVCETDFSGYPDCRDDTMKALQVALTLGMDHRFLIDTPLMWIDKADTWRMAEQLGGKDLVDLIVGAQPHLLPGRSHPPARLGLGAAAAARPASCAPRAGRLTPTPPGNAASPRRHRPAPASTGGCERAATAGAVGNGDQCAMLRLDQRLQPFVQGGLGGRVEGAGGFVHEQPAGLLEQGAGGGQALLFSA